MLLSWYENAFVHGPHTIAQAKVVESGGEVCARQLKHSIVISTWKAFVQQCLNAVTAKVIEFQRVPGCANDMQLNAKRAIDTHLRIP